MRKVLQKLMLAVAVLLPLASQAQLNTYLFSTGVDATRYYELTADSTVLKVGSGQDSYATPVTNIGFTFNFAGVDYTQFSANSDGTVRLGSTVVGTGAYSTPFSATNAGTNAPKICGLGCDGYLTSGGDYIAYQLFGTTGNHVLVIEISTGTYNSTTRDNHYTFQIQLAEADNSVTLAYAPVAPAAGPNVTYQLGASASATDIVLFDVATSTMTAYTSGTGTNNASGTWPAPGRYYTISPDPNACYSVTGLTVSDMSATDATLVWNDNNNSGATYTVYNMADTSVVATGLTAMTYTITGLTANTSYNYGVVANCSATSQSLMATVAFQTPCLAVAVPYTENFDELTTSTTAATGVYVPCWTFVMTGSSTYQAATYQPKVYYSSTNANIGSYSLRLYGVSYTSLPPMAESLSGLQLSFNAYTTSSSYKLAVGVMEGNNFVPVDTINLNTSSHNPCVVYFSGYTGTSHTIAFRNYNTSSSTYTSYVYIDDVEVDYLPTCAAVTGLTAAATAHSAILTWSDLVNTSATYTVSDANGVIATGITGTTYTVTGLTGNTQYSFTVTANCSATDSGDPVSVSVRTDCDVEALPFSEDFSATISSDPCWRGASNATAAQVFAGTALTLGTPSQWSFTSSTRDGLDGGHYYKNVYGSSVKSWMITPAIDLSTVSSAQLSFDVALTDYYNAALPDPDGDTNNSQAFMVIVSTDGGLTWLQSNATIWQNVGGDYTYASLASLTYQNKVISLNQYIGDTIKIAFYCQSLWSGGDNDLHLDNIVVSEVPGCGNVMGLTLDSSNATEAYIHWDNNGATSYEVEVRQNNTVAAGVTAVVTDTTAVISNLVLDNDYQIVVRAVCGSDYGLWTNPLNLHVGYCLPNPSSVDNDGITSVSFGGMTNNTHPTSAAYANYASMSGTVPAGATASVDITYETGYSYGTIIWVDWDNSLSFEGNEVVYVGESTSDDITVLNATFVVPATQPAGSYRMRILGADMAFDSYTTSIAAAAGADPCATYTYGVAEDYTLIVGAALTCLPVSDLTVTSVTATSVLLSWSDTLNGTITYTVYNMADTSVVATNIATTSYEVTGLTASTNYTFGVAANCSATDQSPIVTINARTDCASGSCTVTIDGEDSYGDGWNGASIEVVQNGGVVGTFTLGSGMSTNTATISVCSGVPVTFNWIEGNYDDEASFIILNGAGDTIANVDDASELLSNTIATVADACAGLTPSTFTLTAVANDTTMGDVFYIDMPYEAGDSAFVWAIPNTGYRFVNWTEGTTVVSTDNPYEFVMTGNVSLVANFEVDSTASADSLTIVLAVNDATMGTVTPAPGTYRYGLGETYTFTATPASGYFFGGWIVTMDIFGYTFSDTLVGAPATYTDVVDSGYLGMVLNFTAMFTTDSVPIVNPDSIILTLAVNDPTMGTTNPAPGTYSYTENDSIHVTATAFTGYQFIGWHFEANMFGMAVDTIIYTNENFIDESFEDMGGTIMTVTALFASDTTGPQPTMYTVTVTVNNATMGTVIGAGVYAEGSTVNLTATPNSGFEFVGWVIAGDTITDNPYSFTITSNVTAIAIFAAGSNGIEDADMANVNVYSADSRIIVNGAEGRDINVYDLNGRTVSSMRCAGENAEFRMAHTGVYLVKVGNAAAKRVLVVR